MLLIQSSLRNYSVQEKSNQFFNFVSCAMNQVILLVNLRKVSLHVKSKVITSSEASLTNLTLERLGSSVFSIVTRQLVTSSKSPLTLGPVASIWFFSCMDSLMSFKVGTFCVDFCASWKIATVNPPLLQFGIVSSIILRNGKESRCQDGCSCRRCHSSHAR